MVPAEYVKFSQKIHFRMWFFHFITGITFMWYYVLWHIINLLVWIGLWKKLRIYRVPADPVIWSCRGFGYLWKVFMISWMLLPKNDLNVSHRNQFNTPSNMKLVTSLMNFECHPCGIFEGISQHKEDEAIYPTAFASSVGLGYIIKKVVSSNFMVMESSVSVIFDTGATYSCYYIKIDFVKL